MCVRLIRTVFFAGILTLCMGMIVPVGQAQDTADIERRIELARTLQDLNPVQGQVERAIDRYVDTVPDKIQQESLKKTLTEALNTQAIRNASIDAYAETYTVEELEAMIAFYQNPAARSAQKKQDTYIRKVFPEIIRLLDKAAMRAKTGG